MIIEIAGLNFMAFKKLFVSVPKIYDSVMFPVKEYNAKK